MNKRIAFFLVPLSCLLTGFLILQNSWAVSAASSTPANASELANPNAIADASDLIINEFMASNDTALEDPDEPGDFPDWIEIYNSGTTDVNLQGLHISDDLAELNKFAITHTINVPAGGFVLLYADEDLEQGTNHVDIKLSGGGEDIVLVAADGTTIIDSYTYDAQTTDISEGRCPDGSSDWKNFSNPTPGASNANCNSIAPVIGSVAVSPTQPTASDIVNVTAVITDDQSLVTTTLYYRVDGGPYMTVAMAGSGMTYTAQIPAQLDNALVHYYVETFDNDDNRARFPEEAPDDVLHYLVGFTTASTLLINEFMADNDSTLMDPDGLGGFPDWIELYNGTSAEIDLKGYFLTDDLSDLTNHQITQTLIVSGSSHFILYADNDPEQGPAHLTFALSSNGEDVALVAPDGVTIVDSYTFGAQSPDVSEGRCPSGGATWQFFTAPTPGSANGSCRQFIYLPFVTR